MTRMKMMMMMMRILLLSLPMALTNENPDTPDVISNVNFGSALIPHEELINSGSVWRHTFLIEDIFADPIPDKLRKNSSLVFKGCSHVSDTVAAVSYAGDYGNLTFDKVRNMTRILCEKIVKLGTTFDEQKNLLISEIDSNMRSIRHIAYLKPSLRDGVVERKRSKRAPLEVFGKIGEKVFGIARKKHVKILQGNMRLLEERGVKRHNYVVANIKSLQSINEIQNKIIHNVTDELSDQRKDLDYLIESMNITRKFMEIQVRKTLTNAGYLYAIMGHQSALQADIIEAAFNVLNTLSVLRGKTSELKSDVQRIAQSMLPINLVPGNVLSAALETIDYELMTTRSQFRIAIDKLQYYYGVPISSFAYSGKVHVHLFVPLTTVGARFQNYQIQTFELPVLTNNEESNNKYSKIINDYPYFAISRDKEYYLELTEQDMSRCKGLDYTPKICTPVKFMFSTRSRPSCGLALYTGNSTMMKKSCKRKYFELEQPESRVYQIGTSARLLIVSNEKQFIQHCENGGQMIAIDVCRLCIIVLPCGCIIRSHFGMLPPLLNGCQKNNGTTIVRYPVNLMVLGEMLDESQLELYNGSMTFEHQPTYNLPDFTLKRVKDNRIAEIKQQSYALDKIVQLAQTGSEIFATAEAFVNEPKSLMDQISKTNYGGIIQIVLMLSNAIGILLAVVSYKKGCASATTAAMALQSATKGKAELITFPPILPDEKQVDPWTSELLTIWTETKPIIYCMLIYILFKLLQTGVRVIYNYMSTRYFFTPCDGAMGKQELTNIYLGVSDGTRSIKIYVYTIEATEQDLELIQNKDFTIEFHNLSKWPDRLLSFSCELTNGILLLEVGRNTGRYIKFPAKIFIPITQYFKFRKLLATNYTTVVYIGNGLYRKLEPNPVNVTTNVPITEKEIQPKESIPLHHIEIGGGVEHPDIHSHTKYIDLGYV